MVTILPNVTSLINTCLDDLIKHGQVVPTQNWQGNKSPDDMLEVLNLSYSCPMPEDQMNLGQQTKCDLPWAEDHFKERVAGNPLNPGNEYKNWRFWKNNPEANEKAFKASGGLFSHTYMERYWPKVAGNEYARREFGQGIRDFSNTGIRYEYGDLKDVIVLLGKDTHTRQAYLPVWFPEDTGVLHGGRVPCTLGYHFLLRNKKLHITYYIRACDALRHFRNDIYLSIRLAQWALVELQPHILWNSLGLFTIHISSFHVFNKEKNLIAHV